MGAFAEPVEGVPEELLRAQSLFEHGRWSDARAELLRVREQTIPAARDAAEWVDYRLLICAEKLDDPMVESKMRLFLRHYPESLYRNDVHYLMGLYYCKEEAYDKAYDSFSVVEYKKLSVAQREQFDLRMGHILFTRGEYDESRKYFSRIPLRSDYYDHGLYYMSYIDYSNGNYDAAYNGFHRLMRSQSYAEIAPYYMLQIEFQRGNHRYVVLHGEAQIAKATPVRAMELQRLVAESLFHEEDYADALAKLDAYRKSGGVMGREENYLYGFSLYRTAEYEGAKEYLRKAAGPDDALTQNASYHLADTYLKSGDKRNAMYSFAMASNASHNPVIAEDALFNYAKLQFEAGGGVFNEAIQALTKYISLYPNSARLRTARELLAAAYYNSRNYEAAYEIIAAQPDPHGELKTARQKITYYRGLKALEHGEREAAMEYLRASQALGVSPRYTALALYWQGEIAYQMGDYELALRYYKDFLNRTPKGERIYAMGLYNSGYAHFSQEHMNESRDFFNQFLDAHGEQDAYRSDAINRMADTYYITRDFNEALRLYNQATLSSDGAQSDYARYQGALTMGLVGLNADKIALLRRLVDRGSGDYVDDATYALGRTYIGQESYRDVVNLLEPFVATNEASPYYTAALSDLGLAYLNLGDQTRALAHYERVVAASPHSPAAKDALANIRDIYISRGDADAYLEFARDAGVEGDLNVIARDSLVFAAARRIYQTNTPETAAKSLRSYLESYPKGFYRDDALYFLADSYMKTGQREEAYETLETLSRTDNPHTLGTLQMLSRLGAEQGRYEESAAAYSRLIAMERGTEAKGAAIAGYVRSSIATGDDDRILMMARDVSTYQHDPSPLGQQAWREAQLARAHILERRGETGNAMSIYKTLSATPQSAEGSEASYKVIEDAFQRGDNAAGERLTFEFAGHGTQHAYWLAKAYLLLGDMYAASGDAFQARATYQSIADGYAIADDGILDEARERIGRLN